MLTCKVCENITTGYTCGKGFELYRTNIAMKPLSYIYSLNLNKLCEEIILNFFFLSVLHQKTSKEIIKQFVKKKKQHEAS